MLTIQIGSDKILTNKCSTTFKSETAKRKMKERIYYCIDMKSFFASVECALRGLNPMEAKLIVADVERSPNTICLAVSPKLKSLGVKNRCRFRDIPRNIDFIIAKPRMNEYIRFAADIYDIYLNYISPDDIHVYSIDECFIDATDYLALYDMNAKEFAKFLTDEIALKLHIPATVGIGTNLYLAKIALDITAKKVSDHVGFLNEELFVKTLWNHRPLTDFWGIAKGTASHLERYGIFDMEGIAKAPKNLLYREFGINAELLIDHAFGRETCLMEDIKNYKTKSRSVSTSQVLFADYPFEKALTVLLEMTLSVCHSLLEDHMIAGNVFISVGYSKDIAPSVGKSIKLPNATNRYSVISKYVEKLYRENIAKDIPIRRLGVGMGNLCDETCEGYDIFTDPQAAAKEHDRETAVLKIQHKFGKNAILRGTDLLDGATQKERNKFVGGHNAD